MATAIFHRIGNTYMREPTGEFGLIANIWKRKDPEFAANMQWMHQQQGSPAEPGLEVSIQCWLVFGNC